MVLEFLEGAGVALLLFLALCVVASLIVKPPEDPALDLGALQRLGRLHWGLTQVIEVQWANTITIEDEPGCQFRGAYQQRPDHRHRIYLIRSLPEQERLVTLAHELTHAKQSEAARGYWKWQERCNTERKIDYYDRPMEVEARAVAESLWNVLEPVNSVIGCNGESTRRQGSS